MDRTLNKYAMVASCFICFFQNSLAVLEYPARADTLAAEEIIFQPTDSCKYVDIPDAPCRFFRDAGNRIQMVAAHYTTFRMTGTTFSALTKDCANGPIFSSHNNPDPAMFNDYEWLHSTYTFDGKTIYGFVHNEYHGNLYPGECASGNATRCSYNSVTFCVSADTGKTYTHTAAPGHLIAAIPYQYDMAVGPKGYFNPSNIIKSPRDGYYYMLMQTESYGLQQTGITVFRTNDITNPASWRGWNGTAFTVQLVNPYTATGLVPADHIATVLPWSNEKMRMSVTWNTYFNKFVLVDCASLGGAWGIYYCLSDNLIDWTNRCLIKRYPCNVNPAVAANTMQVGYPSIIDHNDTTRNFEVTGRDCYLYFSKWRKGQNYNRQIIRQPIRFNKILLDTIWVTDTSDWNDFTFGDGVCADTLGRCGLRTAIIEANYRYANYRDSIIPIGFRLTGGGVRTINIRGSLATIEYPVDINGFTQSGAVRNTAAFGTPINAIPAINLLFNDNVGMSAASSRTTIQGLVLSGYNGVGLELLGDSMTVSGCFVGTNAAGTTNATPDHDGIAIRGGAANRIGDGTAGGRNLVTEGIRISGASSRFNMVLGNYLGTDLTGKNGLGTGFGITIQDSASNNTVGGTGEQRNCIAGNNTAGVILQGGGVSGNRIIGNFIGLAADGSDTIYSGDACIYIKDTANNNIVGQASAPNFLCGAATGIGIDHAAGTQIKYNYIGTSASLQPSLGNETGIFMGGRCPNTIIGDSIGGGNTIGFSIFAGIAMRGDAGTGITMFSNRFINNGAFGIDFGSNNQAEPNDRKDPDDGPNNTQNYPILTSAVKSGSAITVRGTINTTPSTTVLLEFFASDSCDASNYGEGEIVLGRTRAVTDTAGDAAFSAVLASPAGVDTGFAISALCTDTGGNTSEFSRCVRLLSPAANIVVLDTAVVVTVGANDSTTVTIRLMNTGTAIASLTTAKNATWIHSLLPASGTIGIDSTLTISMILSSVGLTNSTLYDTITVSGSSTGGAFTLRIPVAMTVAIIPVLTLNPDTIRTGIFVNQQLTYQITIGNTGAAAMRWTAGPSFNSQWLAVSPQNGTVQPGGSAVMTLTIRGDFMGGLPLGLDTGAIIFNASNVTGGTVWGVSVNIHAYINVIPATATRSPDVPLNFGMSVINAAVQKNIRFVCATPEKALLEFSVFTPAGKRIRVLRQRPAAPGYIMFLPLSEAAPGIYLYSLHMRGVSGKTFDKKGTLVVGR